MSHTNNFRGSVENKTTVVERIGIGSDTSTTVSIIRAVAEAESVSPGELPVLADVIDPESIDDIFNSNPAAGRSGVRLSFDYCGYVVEVTDESVTVHQ